MKTTISLPDDLCHEADHFAEEVGWSRSQLYAVALRDFLRRHKRHEIREALDAVYAVHESALDEGWAAAQVEILDGEG